MTPEPFNEALKAARAATGLSQQKLADRMLIPKRTIQKWEIAAAVPPPYVQRFVLNELADLAKKKGE
jgi:DNA-binding transcriptional regulator YiaG